MATLIAEGSCRGETIFKEAARQMEQRGCNRTWEALKNKWNRDGRARFGIDERTRARTSKMQTGLRAQKEKEVQAKAARATKSGHAEMEDGEEGEEMPAKRIQAELDSQSNTDLAGPSVVRSRQTRRLPSKEPRHSSRSLSPSPIPQHHSHPSSASPTISSPTRNYRPCYAGKSLPGQSLPDLSLPGKRVPGKRVPGKRLPKVSSPSSLTGHSRSPPSQPTPQEDTPPVEEESEQKSRDGEERSGDSADEDGAAEGEETGDDGSDIEAPSEEGEETEDNDADEGAGSSSEASEYVEEEEGDQDEEEEYDENENEDSMFVSLGGR